MQLHKLLLRLQHLTVLLLNRLRCGNLQVFTANYTRTILLVVVAKHRPADAFDIVCQEKPVAVFACQVYRGVAPVLGRFGGGGLAGFQVGVVYGGQAVFGQALLAALVHAVEGGQVLAVFDGVFGASENLLYRVVRE